MDWQHTLGRKASKTVLRAGFAAWLALTASASAFSFPSLHLGATNGPEAYVFAAGDKVVPQAEIDAGKAYRLVVLNSAGSVVYSSSCRAGFGFNDNSYTVQANDAPSINGAYTFRVEQYATCSSTQATVITRSFYVARADAFNGTSPTNRFVPGQTASVRVVGLPPNQANWSTTWIMPNGSNSCGNTLLSDRPDSSGSGVLPSTSGTFLVYPPSPSAPDSWNNAANYDAGTCSGCTTNNEGFWKLRLQKSATNFVTLPVFTLTSSCVDATPLTNLTRGVMASALFSTVGSGPGALTYSWYRNDGIIIGETNSSLELTNLTLEHAGTYSVVVSSDCGSTTNSATLSVISCAPNLDVMLVIDRSGSMLGQPYVDALNACTNLVRDLHLGAGDQAGLASYNVVATLDQTLTNNVAMLEQAIGALPPPERGTSISTGLQTARNELLSSRRNPFALPVIVLLSDGLPHGGGDSGSNVLFNAKLAKQAGMLVFSVALGEADPDLMSSVASARNTFFYATNSAQFTELFFAISSLLCRSSTNFVVEGPTNQTICVGASASFNVNASGCEILGYQWWKDGLLIPGGTNATLTVSNAVLSDAATYSVEVRSDCALVTTSAVLIVEQPPTLGDTQAVAVCAGNPIVLESSPAGDGPFTFLWRKDGVALGQTNASIPISSASFADAGEYAIEMHNGCCAFTNIVRLTVGAPVTATPIDDQVHCVGDVAIFTTTFGDVAPSSIVWRKGAVAIPEANNRYLIVPLLSTNDAGTYSVEVSGGCNTVTNHATLRVFQPVTAMPLASRTNFIGEVATFSTIASGDGPFTFLWRKDGVQLPGESSNSLNVMVSSSAEAGEYSVEVGGACQSVTYAATLVVKGSTTATPLVNATNCVGSVTTFSTIAGGTGPFTFVWRKDGQLIESATSNSLVVNITSAANAGDYSVEVTGAGSAVTNHATLVVNELVAATPLANVARCEGANASFATIITGASPLSVQWRRNGVALEGQSNTTLLLSNLAAADSGTYSVEVVGTCNAITNSATLTVSTTTTATPLAAVTACAGSPVAFSTTPGGIPPFSFVWRHKGVVIAGQTNNTLAISSVTASNAGTYSVTVSGSCGVVTNSTALTVSTAIAASMPTNLVICGCDDSVIAPLVTGATPTSFRWYHNGVLISDATNSSLAIPKANRSTPGMYRVEVSGACNTVTNTTTVTVGNATTGRYSSTQSITIPDFGLVSPYPSILEVRCAPVVVSELRVTLHGLSHDYPDDLDIMLVSPDGRALMLMSDSGGTSMNYIQDVTLTFDDAAQYLLADAKRLTNGVYKPTNYGLPDDDIFEAPAPAGPTITNIAGFFGGNPNGQWRLFVVDDHGLDRGALAGGWTLDFGTSLTTDPQLRLAATGVTNGVFNTLLYGTMGATCFIEGSVNMSDWTVISTNRITASPMPIQTTNSTFLDYRFFRASSCAGN